MAKVKNSGDSRCWRGCGERWTLLHCWWDCKMVGNPALWKSVWHFLRKLGMTLLEDPVIPLLGIYWEDYSACNKDTRSIMFIADLFIISRTWKEPRYPSTEKWMQKMWYIYTMESFMKFLDKWMELENIILSEVTQSQKINHSMHSLISGY